MDSKTALLLLASTAFAQNDFEKAVLGMTNDLQRELNVRNRYVDTYNCHEIDVGLSTS